jgi:hypothetical protein
MTNALVNYDELLAQKAGELSKKINRPSGDLIKVTQSKKFRFPDGAENAGPFEAVILDFVSLYQYFPNPFVRDDFATPECYALGENPAELKPSDTAPNKQAESCAVCPQNQWGSARQGKGKACQNRRLLALVPKGSVADHPIWLLSVSPTGIKAFDSYVSACAAHFNAPPIKVVTTIGFDPKSDYPSLRFGNWTPNEELEASIGRMEEARRRLLTEPDYAAMEAARLSQNGKPVTPPTRTASRVMR